MTCHTLQPSVPQIIAESTHNRIGIEKIWIYHLDYWYAMNSWYELIQLLNDPNESWFFVSYYESIRGFIGYVTMNWCCEFILPSARSDPPVLFQGLAVYATAIWWSPHHDQAQHTVHSTQCIRAYGCLREQAFLCGPMPEILATPGKTWIQLPRLCLNRKLQSILQRIPVGGPNRLLRVPSCGCVGISSTCQTVLSSLSSVVGPGT